MKKFIKDILLMGIDNKYQLKKYSNFEVGCIFLKNLVEILFVTTVLIALLVAFCLAVFQFIQSFPIPAVIIIGCAVIGIVAVNLIGICIKRKVK